MDAEAARAALMFLVELGVDEAILDAPVDRTALPATRAQPLRAPAAPKAPAPPPPVAEAPADLANRLARAAQDFSSLAAAMEALDDPLKPGARRFVFADGTAGAPLMVVGEAPGYEEDKEGKPFVGPAGQLLDRMLGAIGRDRRDPDPARGVYITNVLPWRPPANRRPDAAEVARWKPFLLRHIELARPRVLLLAGNTPAQALLGRAGITALRGQWQEVLGRPAMPTFHPSYVLRLSDRPEEHKLARAQVWSDLQAVQARLKESG